MLSVANQTFAAAESIDFQRKGKLGKLENRGKFHYYSYPKLYY